MKNENRFKSVEKSLQIFESVSLPAMPRGLDDDEMCVWLDIDIGRLTAAREAGKPIATNGAPVHLTPEQRKQHVEAIADLCVKAQTMPLEQRAAIEKSLRSRGLL